jgi:ribosome-associated protein
VSTRYNSGTTKITDGVQIEGALADASKLAEHIIAILDEHSAQDILKIDLEGKSSIADYMIVASGRSNRHVSALADYVFKGLKEAGMSQMGIEGQDACDWVLIDAGDVILHVFRPEVREFYNIEKIWTSPAGEGHLSGENAIPTPRA